MIYIGCLLSLYRIWWWTSFLCEHRDSGEGSETGRSVDWLICWNGLFGANARTIGTTMQHRHRKNVQFTNKNKKITTTKFHCATWHRTQMVFVFCLSSRKKKRKENFLFATFSHWKLHSEISCALSSSTCMYVCAYARCTMHVIHCRVHNTKLNFLSSVSAILWPLA